MPLGPYADFDACVAAQIKDGKSKESAEKICGAMKRDIEGSATPEIVADAERRMIAQCGMPFPIVERPLIDVAHAFEQRRYVTKSVPLSLLVATQRDFDPDHVQSLMTEPDAKPIDVVKYLGKYYIDDGHHRAAAAKFRGDPVVAANVVEY
jgi:hypothetical protein